MERRAKPSRRHEICVMCCESAGRAVIYDGSSILAGWRWRADDDPSRLPLLPWSLIGGGRRALVADRAAAQQQRQGRGFRGDDGPVPVIAAATRARRRAGLSRWRRHHPGAEHRHRAPAGRRPADQRQLQRRPGRRARRRAGADRSRHLPGRLRPGGGEEGAGRGDARQRAARPRALRQAGRDQLGRAPAATTPRRRRWRSSRRR